MEKPEKPKRSAEDSKEPVALADIKLTPEEQAKVDVYMLRRRQSHESAPLIHLP